MNLFWGKTIIDQLVLQGVTYFCLAPGFRITPLVTAVAKYKPFVHFDERGLGFHALGASKATGKPVCILVTSGTAVGNLMPAVMEADAANIPLILLTCDRPASLRSTMANQAGDQIKIFGDHTRYFFDLPTPSKSDTIPERFLATTIAEVCHRSIFPIKGPVQLNCPFSEPFLDEEMHRSPSPTLLHYPKMVFNEGAVFAKKLQQMEKGIIVLGGGANAPSAKTLSEKLGWPIFADILSSYRETGDESIINYHHLLKKNPNLKADLILHLGGPLVSKELLHWMKQETPVIHVSENPKRCDPMHIVNERVICFPEEFCQKILPYLYENPQNWKNKIQDISKEIEIAINDCFFGEVLSEPDVIKVLLNLANLKMRSLRNCFGTDGFSFFGRNCSRSPRPAPRELVEEEGAISTKKGKSDGQMSFASGLKVAIFVGNSMPIRDADMFFFPKAPIGPIFANRGLSGIDGNIATCAGIAQTYPLIAVMGDQTFLHDLNSLAQITKTKYPVKLIVINNGGGGIFSFLTISQRKDMLDPYFAAAHTMTFEYVAKTFQLPYTKIETRDELESTLQTDFSCIIEVKTNREENVKLHQKIDQLCSFSSTVS